MRRGHKVQHLLTHSILCSVSRPKMNIEISARDHVKNAAFWLHPHRPCYSGFRDKSRDLHISVSKSSACNAGDLSSIPGSGRSPGEGNGNPLQYSCLENLMDRGPWRTTVSGVTRVGHDLATKNYQALSSPRRQSLDHLSKDTEYKLLLIMC